MGLVWSDYRKVKNNTVILTKATITPEVKDDVWLLWKAVKGTSDYQKLRDDGFSVGKDNFDGNRWKVLWFYDIKSNSFDEVDDVPKWEIARDRRIQKWILKLASIKDALADENSEDSSDHADAYNIGGAASDESSEEQPVKIVKKKPPKKKKAAVRKSKK